MATTPPPITEVRDHDFLINMVDGLVRNLEKSRKSLLTIKTKLDGEIRFLSQKKSVEPEEGLSEKAKVEYANQEALTKKALAEAEIARAAQQEAKQNEYKSINARIANIEKKYQTLLRWRRYMRALDEEATQQRVNEAIFNQQRQQLLAQQEAAFFEKEIAPSLSKEDLANIVTKCQERIVFLETEKNYCVEIIDAIKGTQKKLEEINESSKEDLAILDERDELFKRIIEEAQKELEKTPPGSPMAKLLERRIARAQHEIEDNKGIRELASKIAATSSHDSPESIELERQLQQQSSDFNAICREIEFTKAIKEKALQAAEMAPSLSDNEVVDSSPEMRAMSERFHGAATEFQRGHDIPAASLSTEVTGDAGERTVAEQTTSRATAASLHKLRYHNSEELEREYRLIVQRQKEIFEQEKSLNLKQQQLDPKDPNYYEKALQIENQLDVLYSEGEHLYNYRANIQIDLSQLSKPRNSSLISFEKHREEQRRGGLHSENPYNAAAPDAHPSADKPKKPKPSSPSN